MRRSKNSPETKVAGGRFRFSFAHVLLVLSGMLLMALIQSVFIKTHHSAAQKQVEVGGSTNVIGPWGQLEYTPLALDRPAEYFTNDVQVQKTVWAFPDTTEAQLKGIFASLNLEPDARAFLTDSAHWQKAENGFRILPPPAVVLSLSHDTRAKLYETLARYPENVPHRLPFQFRREGFDQWFDECGLPTNKIHLIRQLTYEHGDNLCFSDAAAFSEISTPAETMCLVKALWRVSTFLMWLRVNPGCDVDALVSYWGRAGRGEADRPMLQSLARLDESTPLPISRFLPPFARTRLYTYPPPNDPRAIREDCFWSSMNFFNVTPDDRFFDPAEIRRALKQDYVRINAGTKQFGDTILLLGPGGKALHMCVYIAADAVFTKNGFATAQPWILMKLNEMYGQYERDRPFETVVYRRKVIPGTEPTRLSARVN